MPITQLLTARPQYGNLWEAFKPGAKERYYSLDLRIQRAFANGFNFLFGYSYLREKTQVLGTGTNQAPQVAGVGAFFLDPLDNYQNRLTYLDSPNPHHRATLAGTYQLPFGKGRPLSPPTLTALQAGSRVRRQSGVTHSARPGFRRSGNFESDGR